jgi:hypothetical protein
MDNETMYKKVFILDFLSISIGRAGGIGPLITLAYSEAEASGHSPVQFYIGFWYWPI